MRQKGDGKKKNREREKGERKTVTHEGRLKEGTLKEERGREIQG